jgi:hypothetical protein
MAKLLNVVVSRLSGKAGVPVTHPDANLLAAFAEHTLLPRERVAISAHLAGCVECREYLALASAAEEPKMSVVAGTARTLLRRRFAEWRWMVTAGVACCILAVALQVYIEPPARLHGYQVASSPPKAAESLTGDARNAEPLKEPAKVIPGRQFKFEHREAKPAERAQRAEKTEIAPQLMVPAPPVGTSPAPAVDTVFALRSMEAPKTDAASGFVEPERHSPLPPGMAPTTSGFVAGAPPNAAMEQIRPTSKRVSLKALARLSPGVLWSINASPDTSGNPRGVVQRSRDAGQTWETVPLSEHVSFRAVAAIGPEVWAGGAGGTLFHSSDGGSHWTEVTVTGGSVKPTGAVVRIDLRAPGELTVTTSAGEDWSTFDAGSHWLRR